MVCNPLVQGTCKPLINNLFILPFPLVMKSLGFIHWVSDYGDVAERTAPSAWAGAESFLQDPLFTKYSSHSTGLMILGLALSKGEHRPCYGLRVETWKNKESQISWCF